MKLHLNRPASVERYIRLEPGYEEADLLDKPAGIKIPSEIQMDTMNDDLKEIYKASARKVLASADFKRVVTLLKSRLEAKRAAHK